MPAFQENKGFSLPKKIIPDFVLTVNPNARMLLILREPSARSYSDYVYFSVGKPNQEEFHNTCKKCITKFNACVRKTQSVEACTYSVKTAKSVLHVDRCRLILGIYYVHVAEWLDRLPPNRLLVLRMEDYKEDMIRELKRIYEFLDLPQLSDTAMTYIKSMKTVNVGKRKTILGPMWPKTQTMLDQFFAPYNKKLAALLGDDRFHWKDVRKKK